MVGEKLLFDCSCFCQQAAKYLASNGSLLDLGGVSDSFKRISSFPDRKSPFGDVPPPDSTITWADDGIYRPRLRRNEDWEKGHLHPNTFTT